TTGRLSSMNPNLQNIPIRTDEGRELRKLFMPSEGNVLIDADYSQIELRLLAHFSGCKELVEAYCEGKDIHATTAAQVFGLPLNEVTSDQRREAKAVNFGIIYGMSAFGLANDLNITAKQAQQYINKYFSTYSDVKEYMNKNVEDATKNGYVTTLFGRRRVINEIRSSNYNIRSFGERAAMNMPLQGSSSDIIKVAMINVSKKLKEGGYKAKLVLQVHDELLIDCPKNEAKEVSEILQTEMQNAVSLAVPLVAEIGMGENWYETK
ncbi:MAG: DNA polymerase I, partial [Clostridia bacterium]|nr:DNA polymerase I [Clostridia bacterium]